MVVRVSFVERKISRAEFDKKGFRFLRGWLRDGTRATTTTVLGPGLGKLEHRRSSMVVGAF